jgi:hypothetical protein
MHCDFMAKKTIEEIENRHRKTGLDDSDRSRLRSLILFSQDASELQSAIFIYAYSFSFDPEVEKVCERFCLPEFWEPGLTAVCLKALIRYWRKEPIHYKQTIDGLMQADEDIWYDEAIFLKRIKLPEYIYVDSPF